MLFVLFLYSIQVTFSQQFNYLVSVSDFVLAFFLNYFRLFKIYHINFIFAICCSEYSILNFSYCQWVRMLVKPITSLITKTTRTALLIQECWIETNKYRLLPFVILPIYHPTTTIWVFEISTWQSYTWGQHKSTDTWFISL